MMSSINKSVIQNIEVGVVVRDEKKLPKDKSSNQRVILPMTHNPDGVKEEHLAHSPMIHAPTMFSQQSFPGHLDPGSLVYFLKTAGETGGIILGQANDIVNYDKGQTNGGKDLLGHQFFQDLFDREINVNIPPNIEETEDEGVKVRKIKEKGKKHKHSLLKGIHSHNSIQSTTGYTLPQVNNIPTAKQQFHAIPTVDMLNNLPGSLMSMSQMFQGLLNGLNPQQGQQQQQNQPPQQPPIDRIRENVEPALFDAIMSISELVQGTVGAPSPAFMTSGRVHPETFLANAEDLLSQVTSLDDVYGVLHRLQYDESLFGLDMLEDAIITVETAFGNANVVMSITGDIDFLYQNTNTSLEFANTITSPTSSPGLGSQPSGGGGGSGGSNMFGKSASTMMDMFKRLPNNNQKEAKNMHETLNKDDMAQKLWKFAETTIKGGNPLDPSHFTG